MPKRATRPRRTGPTGEEASPARPFWSGTITFGLVSVPVNLFPASQSGRQALRMLSPDGVPLSRRYYSAETSKDLDPAEMLRGFEIEKGKYVVVTDEELERLEPEKARDIDLRRFVKADEIQPIYFERAYFLAPATGSVKAYQLLAEIMERTGRAGIATFVMRGKEYLVAIIAEGGILRAETMRFSDEIRSSEQVGLPKPKNATKSVVRRFEKIIKDKSADELSREELRDEQTERLLKLVQQKQRRHKDVVEAEVSERQPGKVVDLMEVLKRSLAAERRPKRRAA